MEVHEPEIAAGRPASSAGRVLRALGRAMRVAGRAPRAAAGTIGGAARSVRGVARAVIRPGIGSWFLRWRAPLGGLAATGYLGIAAADTAAQLDIDGGGVALIAVLIATPIALVAWLPWAAWLVAAGTALVVGASWPVPGGDPWPWPVSNGLVVIMTVVVVAATARLLVTVPVAVATSMLFGAMSTEDTSSGWAVGILLFAAGGALVRWLTVVRRELTRQEGLSEVEKARRTVLEERARIARDLHDVVAHRMSLVVVAAETAPYRVPDVSEPMRAELEAISTTAREALTEMRGLLGVLRSADEGPSYAPQPVLADLATLVDGAIRAGLPVSLRTTGEPQSLRSAVEISAYRIVQESLANAARHAPHARVEVVVTYEPTALRLVVTNGPPVASRNGPLAGGAPAQRSSAGHGLTGMAERAAVVGGWVRAGVTPDGGFEVAAVLPTIDEPTS